MSKALVIKSANFSANSVEQITLSETVDCTGITLNKNTIASTELDATDTLAATITPLDCTQAVVWTSSDNDVATVSNGVVTMVGLGTATITATCGNYSASCVVSVDDVVIDSGFTFAILTNENGRDYVSHSMPYYNRIAFADRVPLNSSRLRLSASNVTTDYYLAPHVLPDGVSKINVKCSNLNTDYSFYMFFFSSVEPSVASSVCAKMLEKITQNATKHSIDYTADIPAGADSFAVMVYTSKTYTESDDVDTIAGNIGYEITYKAS